VVGAEHHDPYAVDLCFGTIVVIERAEKWIDAPLARVIGSREFVALLQIVLAPDVGQRVPLVERLFHIVGTGRAKARLTSSVAAIRAADTVCLCLLGDTRS